MNEADENTIKLILQRLDDLSHRIENLEKEPKTKWYKLANFQDMIKWIGLPAAFIAAIWATYDGFYLRIQNKDEATVTAVQQKIAELQSLRQEAFQKGAEGGSAFQIFLESKGSLRDRLTKETYEYWTIRPEYFTWLEKQMLAGELRLVNRPTEALEVTLDLEESADTDINLIDTLNFKGSLLALPGPTFDLDMARNIFKSGIKLAQKLDSIAKTEQMQAKIIFNWLFAELSNKSNCIKIKPVAEALAALIEDDPDNFNLGALNDQAEKMLVVYESRCSLK